jgi:hypothetical protein
MYTRRDTLRGPAAYLGSTDTATERNTPNGKGYLGAVRVTSPGYAAGSRSVCCIRWSAYPVAEF